MRWYSDCRGNSWGWRRDSAAVVARNPERPVWPVFVESGMLSAMSLPTHLDQLSADELRQLAQQLAAQVASQTRLLTEQDARLADKDKELHWRQTRIDQLTHELALHKRWRFGVKTEHWPAEQRQLFEETIDTDLAAMETELAQLSTPSAKPKGQAKRQPLPAHLPRTEIHHEPDSTTCACGCQLRRIGEDVAEKLDYTPGSFTVERHIRGKWVCQSCETLIQAPVPAQVIDKGMPTSGLLTQVLIGKYLDHLPLYRQERIFERAGVAIPRSTLAQWVGQCGVALQPLVDALKQEMLTYPVLHADETPVALLNPGSGKTDRAYLWAYSIGAHHPSKPWFMTLPTVVPAAMPATSSATGAARWCVMIMPATRRCSATASPKPAAWRMPEGNSSTCKVRTRA